MKVTTLKKLLKIAGFVLLSSCGNSADRAPSQLTLEKPEAITPALKGCEGQATEPEGGYIVFGIDLVKPTVSISLYESRKSAKASEKPIFEAEWASELDTGELVDSLIARVDIKDPHSDGLHVLFTKLDPKEPKASGFISIGTKHRIFTELTCNYGKPK